MRMVLVLVMVAGCISPIMTFGEGKSAKEAQRQTMSDITPVRLATGETWKGTVETRKVRVWADGHYRAQNVRWQQTFEASLELANVVLTPAFGLALVAEYHVWERHVPGSSLADDLAALEARDDGAGAFAVVGLTSSLPLVSATFDELGLAMVGGRHMMVRGYADLEERKLYADVFRDLLPEERELALAQRRDHKTAVVLLHEIAHNLGVDHDPEDEMITSGSYSHRATTFSPRAREVMLREVGVRVGRASAGEPQPAVAKRPSPKPRATEPIVLHINAAGRIVYEARQLDHIELVNVLAPAYERDAETEVVIKRARKAPADSVTTAVHAARNIGFTRISIATD